MAEYVLYLQHKEAHNIFPVFLSKFLSMVFLIWYCDKLGLTCYNIFDFVIQKHKICSLRHIIYLIMLLVFVPKFGNVLQMWTQPNNTYLILR